MSRYHFRIQPPNGSPRVRCNRRAGCRLLNERSADSSELYFTWTQPLPCTKRKLSEGLRRRLLVSSLPNGNIIGEGKSNVKGKNHFRLFSPYWLAFAPTFPAGISSAPWLHPASAGFPPAAASAPAPWRIRPHASRYRGQAVRAFLPARR